MARYLSQSWAEELNAAVGASGAVEAAGAGSVLTVQQVVTGGPDGDVRYWVRLGPGPVTVGLGEVPAPDVTITEPYETAVAVNRGELTSEAAFLSGRAQVSGDLAALVEHQATLQGLGAAAAAVRAHTSYGTT